MEELLELCASKKFDEEGFSKILSTTKEKPSVDIPDEHGMTCLMHSAYNGHLLACEKLVAVGADVNANTHKDGYSALMFASIAGRNEVVSVLLKAGARTSSTNNMGKTAASMAAFVGQHSCAQMINNHVSLEEVLEYMKGAGPLPPAITTSLLTLLTCTNIHPVKLLQLMQISTPLIQEVPLVSRALAAISLGLINDQREELALKAHYISYLLNLAHNNGFSSVMKRLLTSTEDGEWVELDLILRQCLKEYRHVHTTLLQQMITTLARITPGKSPSAYSIFVSAIIGDKGAEGVSDGCCVCGSLETLKKCSKCRKVLYCSVDCQKLAWTKGNHKKLCMTWASQATPT